ncbi:MAG TPA: bi-domain-containing oxidoreductase [bacterium]
MKQVVQDARKGLIKVIDVPVPLLKDNCILVKNRYSLISAGTEKLMLEFARKSLLGKARARPDLFKQIREKMKRDGIGFTIQRAMRRLEVPSAVGYSCAGEIVEIGKGISGVKPGDGVACAGAGYANHAEYITVPKNLFVKIPTGVDYKAAAYATVGSVALHGIRTAGVSVNESVTVIGAGLIGQITMQILKAAGCRVVGFDTDKRKIAFALKHGLSFGASSDREIISLVDQLTNGRGLDCVIITASTTSNEPVELAGELLRDRGKVVVVGSVKMDIPRRTFYNKELDLIVSRSYGPGRYDTEFEEKGHDYPMGYVRWTETRNMESVLELIKDKKLDVDILTSHIYNIDEVEKAYKLISGKGLSYYGILLKFDPAEPAKTISLKPELHKPSASVRIGVIGAGNFARDFLLPQISKMRDISIHGVATAKGLSARYVADKYSVNYITTDSNKVLHDKDINTVFIFTRHDTHASYTIEALKHNKHVFVEKPLATSENQLQELIQTWKRYPQMVMVGYNRRFSPIIRSVLEKMPKGNPQTGVYRINAGAIPSSSWVHDENEGGGRIIGEVCHFVDLAMYLTASRPSRVYSTTALSYDNVSCVIEFENGSVFNIIYTTLGNPALPKERIEIYSQGKVAIIDDFRGYSIITGDQGTIQKSGKTDKGFLQEIISFIDAVKNGTPPPISFEDLVISTYTTLKIIESASKNMPVKINLTSLIDVK